MPHTHAPTLAHLPQRLASSPTPLLPHRQPSTPNLTSPPEGMSEMWKRVRAEPVHRSGAKVFHTRNTLLSFGPTSKNIFVLHSDFHLRLLDRPSRSGPSASLTTSLGASLYTPHVELLCSLLFRQGPEDLTHTPTQIC